MSVISRRSDRLSVQWWQVVRRAGPCAAAVLFASAAVHAQSQTQSQPLQLPTAETSGQARMLSDAEAQYRRYAAAPDTYFNVDTAKSADWPCQVSDAQLGELTGTSNYAAGSGAAGYGHSYSDLVIRPVTATCKAGKLDGQVELVYETVRRAWGPAFQNSAKEVGRVVATVSGGKVVQRFELRKSTALAPDGNASGKAADVASSIEQRAGDFTDSATILVTGDGTKSFLKRPVKTQHGMRLEKRYYVGSTLISVEQADASGKPDGLAVDYAGGQAQKRCYRQGNVVDPKNCGG